MTAQLSTRGALVTNAKHRGWLSFVPIGSEKFALFNKSRSAAEAVLDSLWASLTQHRFSLLADSMLERTRAAIDGNTKEAQPIGWLVSCERGNEVSAAALIMKNPARAPFEKLQPHRDLFYRFKFTYTNSSFKTSRKSEMARRRTSCSGLDWWQVRMIPMPLIPTLRAKIGSHNPRKVSCKAVPVW